MSRSGWGRAGHRRAVLIGGLVFAIVVGGGVAAWAEVSGSTTGYRMATVTRANIGTDLTVVGSVAPVSDAAPAFQVAGKVATVTVTPGSQVTAGETLGTLDTTALSEAVSSAQSTLSADEAKLAEDEANESSGGSSNGSSNTGTGSNGSSPSTTTTTAPGHGGGTGTPTKGGQGGSTNQTITQDQNTLTQDQLALSKAQQVEAADLAQAQTDCTSANTSTSTGQATCESALETVSADEQTVSTDQSTVSKDETALSQALAAASSSGSGATGNTGGVPSSTGNSGSSTGHAESSNASSFSGNTGSTGTGTNGSGGSGTSGNTDTPEQIASDQAAIDTAQADLTEAQQSLKEATLTSPINGTVVSVAINVGDTVSAGSSTEIITILGTNSYEVEATLDSSQIPSIKVGQPATVEVDGVDGSVQGTVSQVGPVQSGSSGYSYPVIVALPSSSASTVYSGSTANVSITTGAVSDVVAVPTSAVQTLGTRSYVIELSKGQLTRKFVKVGMVGDIYTQVESGLSPGQSVVLVDYAEAVPSSNTNTTGLGNLLGGGGNGVFGGGGVFFGGGGNGSFQIRRLGAGVGG